MVWVCLAIGIAGLAFALIDRRARWFVPACCFCDKLKGAGPMPDLLWHRYMITKGQAPCPCVFDLQLIEQQEQQ